MFRRLLLILALVVLPTGRGEAAPAATPDPQELCAGHIAAAEKLLGLPAHLLGAIAQVESGRWNREQQAILAWPWTVMAEGKGRYLPTREAAIREVQALQARGVRNIDVGCMQINLRHHPAAFDDLEQAFEPAYNVAYGASFLVGLYRELNSWTRAIGRYHSATPQFANRYRAKVMRAWREEKRRAREAALIAPAEFGARQLAAAN